MKFLDQGGGDSWRSKTQSYTELLQTVPVVSQHATANVNFQDLNWFKLVQVRIPLFFLATGQHLKSPNAQQSSVMANGSTI